MKHEILDSFWLYCWHLSPLHTCLVNTPWSAGCPVAPGWGAEVGVPAEARVEEGMAGQGKPEAAAGRAERRDVAPGGCLYLI